MPSSDRPRDDDRKFLTKIGVAHPTHQGILLGNLPCGIKTAREAFEDGTPWQINAPRAILVCVWKGMVAAFQKLEQGPPDASE